MMATDSSAFSCLPHAVRDSILQQAFRQLDRRHLFGVAPLVCHLWHQLASSIITSVDAELCTEAAVEQLSLWIQNHGAGLDSMVLQMNDDASERSASRCILQALTAATMLRSLAWKSQGGKLQGFEPQVLDLPLPPLTTLTRVSISACQPEAVLLDSLLHLPNLSSLSMCRMPLRTPFGPFLKGLSESLVKLTYLDFRGSSYSIEDLLLLRNLPELQELFLTYDWLMCNLAGMDPSDLNRLVGLPIRSIGIDLKTNSSPETMSQVCSWVCKYGAQLQGLGMSRLPSNPPFQAHALPLLDLVHMKSLVLQGVQPNLNHLPMLTQLTELVLYGCGIDDGDVCRLAPLSALQRLSLSWNVGVKGENGSMETLARAMPALTTLELTLTDAEESAALAFGQRIVTNYHDFQVLLLSPLSVAELSV